MNKLLKIVLQFVIIVPLATGLGLLVAPLVLSDRFVQCLHRTSCCVAQDCCCSQDEDIATVDNKMSVCCAQVNKKNKDNVTSVPVQDCCPLDCQDSETCGAYCCDGTSQHDCKSPCCNGEVE